MLGSKLIEHENAVIDGPLFQFLLCTPNRVHYSTPLWSMDQLKLKILFEFLPIKLLNLDISFSTFLEFSFLRFLFQKYSRTFLRELIE